jgi:hypothetical protein
VPSAKHFGRVLRELPNAALQFLLDGTVTALRRALPPAVHFGDAVAGDTKHIIAWVKENNPKAYASGVIATKVPDWGEFVLAELTQTFDQPDVSYFFPLMAQVERRLGRKPRYGAFDMGFDAHYIYDYFQQAGGFAAVPLAERGDTSRQLDAAGLALWPAGLAMPCKGVFTCHTTRIAQQRGRYACPLRYPKPTADACPISDPHWATGGCVVTMPTSSGARIRYQLDRDSADFKAIYKQRTADERVNSQALELGIERPKLRNAAAIANQNTLIYVLINLRALQRVRAHQAELAQQRPALPAAPGA